MKICHVITRLIIGGAQENTLLTCAGLHEKGHQVCLVTGADTGPEGSLLEEARAGGYEVRVVPTLRRAVRPFRDRRAGRDLSRLFAELRPDIVHTHSSKAGILGRLAARRAGVPIVVHTIHGMSFNRTQPVLSRTLYRQADRYCARHTDRIITVADAMTTQAVAAGLGPAHRFITIYSGMRTEWYDPGRYDRREVRKRWGVADDEVVVGTVARLFRHKGYEQLIPALARAAVHPATRLRFVWIGDGPQRSHYERQLEALGIRSRVIFTGLVAPSEVAELLSGIDILTHASQWEGLPRAVVQAALMEKPAIGFDVDGTPEVILPGQTGLLVRLNDVDALARAIIALAADPARRHALGRSGRQLCRERFDHRVMVERIEAVYRDLLAADGCGNRA